MPLTHKQKYLSPSPRANAWSEAPGMDGGFSPKLAQLHCPWSSDTLLSLIDTPRPGFIQHLFRRSH